MGVLISYKNIDDPIENEGTREVTAFHCIYIDLRRSRTANYAVKDRSWLKFKLIQAFDCPCCLQE